MEGRMWQRCFQRAWNEVSAMTLAPHRPLGIIMVVVVWSLAVAVYARVAPAGDVRAQVLAGVAGAAAFVMAFGVAFCFLLLRAPYALEREDRLKAESALATALQERDALLARQQLLPSVRLSTRRDDSDFLLVVQNEGPAAVFHANMRIRAASPLREGVGETHRLWWGRARAVEARIVHGGEDSCRIAKVDSPGPVLGAHMTFSLYRFDEDFRTIRPFWNVGYLPDQSSAPIAYFDVIITAEPEMAGGPIVQRFKLGPWTLLAEGEEGYSDGVLE